MTEMTVTYVTTATIHLFLDQLSHNAL